MKKKITKKRIVKKEIGKSIYWALRILVLGLFIHNISALILIIILLISWRREIVSGIVFHLERVVLLHIVSH